MNVLKLYQKLARFPLGKEAFSQIFCTKAPYFRSIHPIFEELAPGVCIVSMKKRRSVQNHLGTVHAIALCNLAEAAAGLCLEASLPRDQRWIPKGMQVDYLKKASTDVTATCRVSPGALSLGENTVDVEVTDRAGASVVHARITMYVSTRKS